MHPLIRSREWWAERYRRTQFPRQQSMSGRPPVPSFKNAMPWEVRSLLVLLAAYAVLLGGVGVAVAGFILWAIITG